MSDEVKYSCGHTAPRTHAYQPWHKCPDCHRNEGGASKRNQEAGLPPLKGTEKQIHWAESIRDNAHRTLAKYMGQWCEITLPHVDLIQQRLGTKIREVLDEEDATWWIGNKDIDWPLFIVNKLLGEAAKLRNKK